MFKFRGEGAVRNSSNINPQWLRRRGRPKSIGNASRDVPDDRERTGSVHISHFISFDLIAADLASSKLSGRKATQFAAAATDQRDDL